MLKASVLMLMDSILSSLFKLLKREKQFHVLKCYTQNNTLHSIIFQFYIVSFKQHYFNLILSMLFSVYSIVVVCKLACETKCMDKVSVCSQKQ